jgi:hypothetical protein
MKKSIIAVGDSFTYGEGLQYFSNLPSVIFPDTHQYNPKYINAVQHKFIEKYRYIQQVADTIGTTAITRSRNGGSHKKIEEFLEMVLPTKSIDKIDLQQKLEHYTFTYDPELALKDVSARLDEISHLIIQTTNPMRDDFEFERNGIKYNTNQFKQDREKCLIFKEFMEYAIENFGGYNGLEEYVFKLFLDRIVDRCKIYESAGIKIMLLLWQNENNKVALEHEYFKDKIVKIYYNNNEYTSIREWQMANQKFFLKNSFRHIQKCKNDDHPTLEGHSVIAESIIKQL